MQIRVLAARSTIRVVEFLAHLCIEHQINSIFRQQYHCDCLWRWDIIGIYHWCTVHWLPEYGRYLYSLTQHARDAGRKLHTESSLSLLRLEMGISNSSSAFIFVLRVRSEDRISCLSPGNCFFAVNEHSDCCVGVHELYSMPSCETKAYWNCCFYIKEKYETFEMKKPHHFQVTLPRSDGTRRHTLHRPIGPYADRTETVRI